MTNRKSSFLFASVLALMLFLMPHAKNVAHASWYNPATWFGQDKTSSITSSITSSSTSVSDLQERVDELTSQNQTLMSKLDSANRKLANAQDELLSCKSAYHQVKSVGATTPGSIGIIASADVDSPRKSLIQVSTSDQTTNVVLGVVDIKSQDKDAVLRAIKFMIVTSTSTGDIDPTSVFTDLKIKVGNLVYPADAVPTVSGGLATFNNLVITLPQGVNVPVSIIGNIAQDTDGSLDNVTSSTTLAADMTNIIADDGSHNTVPVNNSTLILNESTYGQSLR